MKLSKKTITILWIFLSISYLVTHLYKLTALPVFADEAIYIRWSQLIIDDWKQYLFFPLNDGKTPLHMWLMVPFQLLFNDQLFAGRLVSVLVGLVQLPVVYALVRACKGRVTTAFAATGLTAILPFWYFHHRMALIDALLTFWLSITVLGVALISQHKKTSLEALLLVMLGFGTALLTKLPAVLFIPTFYVLLLLQETTARGFLRKAVAISCAIGGGAVLFLLLKLHPAFGQLFSRGSDFLFPISDVIEGKWQETIRSIPTYIGYFLQYLSWPVFCLILVGLFSSRVKKQTHIFFWSGVLFVIPIMLLGRVVYPRYFFPASLYFTVAAAFGLEGLVGHFSVIRQRFLVRFAYALAIGLLLSNMLTYSAQFILASVTDTSTIPFVSADRKQYLTEWSSGHGIAETVSLIRTRAQTERVAIATEGRFGTLPDGILMYLHRTPVDTIYVEGLGYPLTSIPDFFRKRAEQADSVWLVVNEHRLTFQLPKNALIAEYCRPFAAPCLQVWDISSLLTK